MPKKESERSVLLPLEWNVPDDLVARYATNMVVQRAENEFLISFFEVKPPIILGEPEQIVAQVKNLKSMKAKCVAQIIVAADKMPDFVKAFTDNLNQSMTFVAESKKEKK